MKTFYETPGSGIVTAVRFDETTIELPEFLQFRPFGRVAEEISPEIINDSIDAEAERLERLERLEAERVEAPVETVNQDSVTAEPAQDPPPA